MSRESQPGYELQPDRPAAQMSHRRIWADRLNQFGWAMAQIAKLEMLNRYDQKYGNRAVKDFFRKYDSSLEQALKDEKSGKGIDASVGDFLQGGGACYRQIEALI